MPSFSQCRGINIEGKVIPQSLTQEMTAGELKFALEVETVLNTIPQPEYRQLVVEVSWILQWWPLCEVSLHPWIPLFLPTRH